MSQNDVMEAAQPSPPAPGCEPVTVILSAAQVSSLAQLIEQRIADLRDARQQGAFEPEVVGLWLPIMGGLSAAFSTMRVAQDAAPPALTLARSEAELDLRRLLDGFTTKTLAAAYEQEAQSDLPHTIPFDRDAWKQQDVLDAIMLLGLDRARRVRDSAQEIYDAEQKARESKINAVRYMFNDIGEQPIRKALAHHVGTDDPECSEGDILAMSRTELIEYMAFECSTLVRADVRRHAARDRDRSEGAQAGADAAHGATSPDPEPDHEDLSAARARARRIGFMHLSEAYAAAAPGRVPDMAPSELLGAVMVLRPEVRSTVLADAERRETEWNAASGGGVRYSEPPRPPKGTPFEVEVTDAVRVIVAHHEGKLHAVAAELMLPSWKCDAIMGRFGANVRTLRALGENPSPAAYQAAKAAILDRMRAKFDKSHAIELQVL